jgi:hypothetical protein
MKYQLDLIPLEEGKPVMFLGKDYSSAARVHNVTLKGIKYYLRQNHTGEVRQISSILEEQLEVIVGALPSHIPLPIKITIAQEE